MESLIGRTVFFGRGDPEPEAEPEMPGPAPLIEEPALPKAITYGFDDDSDRDDEVPNVIGSDLPSATGVTGGTVVSLAEVDGPNGAVDDEDDEDDEDDNEDVPAGIGAPVAPMDIEAPATATKKRGRPSLSASASRAGTPAAKGRTPGRTPGRAIETPSTNGIKRKATDKPTASAPPSAKRGRPGNRAPSARKAAKEAAVKTSAAGKRKAASGTKTPKVPGKRGRPAKQANDIDDDDPATFDVEKIVEDAIDADTMQHMFLIKWKGYPDSDNTWEPRSNVSNDAIALFEKAKKKEAAANRAPRAPRGTKAPKAPKAPRVPKPAKVTKKSTGRPRGRPARKAKA